MSTLTGAPAAQRELEQVVQRIVETYAPDKIILFGSHAYGVPRPDSDLDLLILKETTDPPRERWFQVRKALWSLPIAIPVEPIVLTEAELAARLAMGDQFFEEIVARGVTLHDRQGINHSR
jgi:predicted nucleotidyltransferase